MAEVLALRVGSWATAMAIEYLVKYFSDSIGQGVEKGIGKWSKTLKEMIASAEEEAIQGQWRLRLCNAGGDCAAKSLGLLSHGVIVLASLKRSSPRSLTRSTLSS